MDHKHHTAHTWAIHGIYQHDTHTQKALQHTLTETQRVTQRAQQDMARTRYTPLAAETGVYWRRPRKRWARGVKSACVRISSTPKEKSVEARRMAAAYTKQHRALNTNIF